MTSQQQQPEHETALAISGDDNPGMAIFGNGVRALEATNFDKSDPSQENAYLAASMGPADELQSVVNTEIDVAAFVASPIQARDKNGQPFKGVRTVLVTADGRRFATWSSAVAQAMAVFNRTSRGRKIFNPPFRCKVGLKKTQNGFQTVTLDLVTTVNGESPKKGK